MIVLGTNVLIIKQKQEYSGLIQGVESDEAIYGKIAQLGEDVYDANLEVGKLALLDWAKTKKVKNDLYVIQADDIIAVLDEGEVANA